jgi:hypothetical protein
MVVLKVENWVVWWVAWRVLLWVFQLGNYEVEMTVKVMDCR